MPSSPGDRAPKRNNARPTVECPHCHRQIGLMCNGQMARHLTKIGMKCPARQRTPYDLTEHYDRRFGLKETPHG